MTWHELLTLAALTFGGWGWWSSNDRGWWQP